MPLLALAPAVILAGLGMGGLGHVARPGGDAGLAGTLAVAAAAAVVGAALALILLGRSHHLGALEAGVLASALAVFVWQRARRS